MTITFLAITIVKIEKLTVMELPRERILDQLPLLLPTLQTPSKPQIL